MVKEINFLNDHPKKSSPDPTKTFLRSLFYPIIFVGIFIFIFSFQVLLSGENLDGYGDLEPRKFSFLNVFGFSHERELKGESDDRINIILTGMGGLGHSGPFLTDTIIVASYKPSTHEVAMLSIPRDLSVSIPGYGWRRVNSVNHYGELQDPGRGAAYTADFLSDLLGIDIHYYVRVDFQGFVDLIDELDGLDVYVDNAFTDSQFPDNNYGYQTIFFDRGWQHMDGQTALNYARSRHGNNGEGSDFARSQRQQKVLKGLKDKLLSAKTFLSPTKLGALYDTYNNNVSTNMETWEMVRFAQLAKDIHDDAINTLVLDNSANGLLYSTLVNGAYLLVPRDESFYEIQQVAEHIFDPQDYLNPDERPVVEIRNGTKIGGLAYQTSVNLTRMGFDIEKIGNAVEQNYEKTVIYDLTGGQKNHSLERIIKELNANVTTEVPRWLSDDPLATSQEGALPPSDADFLIILGQEHAVSAH
jgi:LCP family protein required for cell wall assembly